MLHLTRKREKRFKNMRRHILTPRGLNLHLTRGKNPPHPFKPYNSGMGILGNSEESNNGGHSWLPIQNHISPYYIILSTHSSPPNLSETKDSKKWAACVKNEMCKRWISARTGQETRRGVEWNEDIE